MKTYKRFKEKTDDKGKDTYFQIAWVKQTFWNFTEDGEEELWDEDLTPGDFKDRKYETIEDAIEDFLRDSLLMKKEDAIAQIKNFEYVGYGIVTNVLYDDTIDFKKVFDDFEEANALELKLTIDKVVSTPIDDEDIENSSKIQFSAGYGDY